MTIRLDTKGSNGDEHDDANDDGNEMRYEGDGDDSDDRDDDDKNLADEHYDMQTITTIVMLPVQVPVVAMKTNKIMTTIKMMKKLMLMKIMMAMTLN